MPARSSGIADEPLSSQQRAVSFITAPLSPVQVCVRNWHAWRVDSWSKAALRPSVRRIAKSVKCHTFRIHKRLLRWRPGPNRQQSATIRNRRRRRRRRTLSDMYRMLWPPLHHAHTHYKRATTRFWPTRRRQTTAGKKHSGGGVGGGTRKCLCRFSSLESLPTRARPAESASSVALTVRRPITRVAKTPAAMLCR